MEIPVNFLAVIVAAFLDMLLGMFWYSKFGFGKIWMKMMNKTEEQIHDGNDTMGVSYVATTLGSVVMAFVLAHAVKFVGATDYVAALQTGFWVWLGFIAAGLLPVYIFEDRKKGLYALYVGYKFVSVLAMAVLLTLWA